MLIRSRKIEVVSFPSMNNEHKVPRLEFLTRLKVVYRKVPKGFNRKAFLSKGISKRETAKLFVLRVVEILLQKIPLKIFVYLFSEVLCNISQVCVTTSRKGASLDLLQRLDQERFFQSARQEIIFYAGLTIVS